MRWTTRYLLIAVLVAGGSAAADGPFSGPWVAYSGEPAFQVSPRGKVWPVVWWVEDRAHDPGSIEWVDWSPLMTNGAALGVNVRYRARNAFGGLVLVDRVFFLDSAGRVLGHD